MPSQPLEPGEDLKQFRKVIVNAGPLKGARYTDVCLDDLRKAAKSYKQDPRFNQYAKRVMSEKALGNVKPEVAAADGPKTWKTLCREWAACTVSKVKGKTLWAFFALLICCILLTMVVRLVLRRSIGLIALILDALLDEAAVHLEASLLTAPAQHNNLAAPTVLAFEIQQHLTYGPILMHIFFTAVGAILGRHWRAPAVRPATPTRLRVV